MICVRRLVSALDDKTLRGVVYDRAAMFYRDDANKPLTAVWPRPHRRGTPAKLTRLTPCPRATRASTA